MNYRKRRQTFIKVNKIINYINYKDKIIDIGTGNGLFADVLRRLGYNIQGLDVRDYNQTLIKNTTYDGKRMPFIDNRFDVAIFINVLHHCNNTKKVLQEALRISKKVLIMDVSYTGKFQRVLMDIHDHLSNIKYENSNPAIFYQLKRWIKLLNRLNVAYKIHEWHPNYDWFDIGEHVFFELQ